MINILGRTFCMIMMILGIYLGLATTQALAEMPGGVFGEKIIGSILLIISAIVGVWVFGLILIRSFRKDF